MADSNDWRSNASRQQMIRTIEAALRKGQINNQIDINKIMQFEGQLFSSSTDRDAYKAKLRQLIIHLQNHPIAGKSDSHGKQQQDQQPPPQQQPTIFHQNQQQPTIPNMSGQAGHLHQMQGHRMVSNNNQQLVSNTMTSQPMQQIIRQQPMGQMTQQVNQPQVVSHQQLGIQQMSQQSVSQQQIGQQPLGQHTMSHQSMNQQPTSYASDSPYGQTSIPISRSLYSPSQSLPMHSPTPGMVRAPQPSPSMSVNTPAPNIPMTPGDPQAPSPVSLPSQPGITPTGGDEEQLYIDKVRELSTYIEPLKNMIAEMSKEGKSSQPEYQRKLQVMLNLLQPNNNKTSYQMLCKCEDVLKKLNLPMPIKTADVIPIPEQSSSHWCQPLLTSVAENIMNSSMCKHALRQTFGPALHSLYGPNIGAAVEQAAQNRKRKSKESSATVPKSARTVPNLIQGELARLDKKFKVTRDKNFDDEEFHSGMGLKLQCNLVDASLPPVPSIKFTLSDDYPSSLPHVDLTMELYNSSNFFQEIKTKFLSNLKRLQDKYSMTALLETWLASVRQVCANLKKEKTTLPLRIEVAT